MTERGRAWRKTAPAAVDGAERFRRVDLSEYASETLPEPEYVVPGVVYAGRSTTIVGKSGHGKTLMTSGLVLEAIRGGVRVAMLDEENGPEIIASRLMRLGATPTELSWIEYYPFPSPTLAEMASLVGLLDGAVDLAVFDSRPDFFDAANLDDNSNSDATRWAKAATEALSRLGIATLVLDAVPVVGELRTRGAGAKTYKADAEFLLDAPEPPDVDRQVTVRLLRKKDRLGRLPKDQAFLIGGRGDGTDVFMRTVAAARPEADRSEVLRARVRHVLEVERAWSRETALSSNRLRGLVNGQGVGVDRAARAEADDPDSPVVTDVGLRGARLYWRNDLVPTADEVASS